MRAAKGQYGCRDGSRRMRIMLVGMFLAAILLQLMARHLTTRQDVKNILTVMAVLTVLPMANIAAPLLASWKYRTPPRALYERAAGYGNQFLMVYDLVLTSRDQVMPMDIIAVLPKAVIAYCTNPKADASAAEKFLTEMLRRNKLDAGVQVIKDERNFFKRLDYLKSAAGSEADGSEEYIAALMKSLSM